MMPEGLVGSLSITPMLVEIVLFRIVFKWIVFLFAWITIGFMTYGAYAFKDFLVGWIAMATTC